MGEHHHHHHQQQQEQQKQQEKQQEKEEDWKEVVRRGGSLREVSLDNGVRGWASPPGNFFAVRGPHYFSKKQKSAAGDCLLTPLGMDWLRSHSRLDHVLSHPSNRVMTTYHVHQNHANSTCNTNKMKKKHGPFFMAINLQVPGRDHHSAIFYYVTEDPILPESLLHRFIHGDDSFRNARFKLINRIVRGPWIVRATVGNHAACLLGKALTCTYIKGPDYLEIDVDIGSSALASAILHLALGYVNSVTVDMAFLIESQAEEELPERILGSVRVAQIEMEAAVHVEAAHGPPSDPHFVGSEISTTTTTTTTTSSWRKFSRSFSLLGHTGKPSKVEVEVEIEQKYEHEEKVLTKY